MKRKKENFTLSFKPAIFVFVVAIAIGLSSFKSANAQGDLLIFPKRIVFEGRNRVEQVILSNTGKDSATYNISFIQYSMTETGDFVGITEADSGQRFATPFLRVYPRRVDLAPGESQTVKVQVTNTDKLEEGEYRSHLYFRAEKNNQPRGQENEGNDSNTLTIKLDAVFGISIATIIRKGQTNTVVSISDMEYTSDGDANHFLHFSINRTGNISTYGDITINYISSEDKKFEVGKARGLAVYTPGDVRKVKMLLLKPDGVNFSTGKFEVIYTENESKKIITEMDLTL